MFRGNEFNLLYVTIAVSSNSIFQLPSAVVSERSEGEEKERGSKRKREREREPSTNDETTYKFFLISG